MKTQIEVLTEFQRVEADFRRASKEYYRQRTCLAPLAAMGNKDAEAALGVAKIAYSQAAKTYHKTRAVCFSEAAVLNAGALPDTEAATMIEKLLCSTATYENVAALAPKVQRLDAESVEIAEYMQENPGFLDPENFELWKRSRVELRKLEAEERAQEERAERRIE